MNPKRHVADPMAVAAIYDPTPAESLDILDQHVGVEGSWDRETIGAALSRMASSTPRSLPVRAVAVLEKFLQKEPDPLDAIVEMGRPQHDVELTEIVTVR